MRMENNDVPAAESPRADSAPRSAALSAILARIEANEVGMLDATWDDAASDATASDLREALLAAIAQGRFDIVDMFIAKLGIEYILTIAPDALAVALLKGDAKMLRMLIKKGFLRSSTRRNAKLLAEAKVYGDIPALPALTSYRLGNGALGVVFLSNSLVMLALDGSGLLSSVYFDLDAASSGAEAVPVSSLSAQDLHAICLERSQGNQGLEALAAMPIVAIDAADITAQEAGVFPMHDAVIEADMERLATLIQTGKDVNERDAQGNTPLMVAAREGNFEATRQLLTAGADPMLLNHEGEGAIKISKDLGARAQHEALARVAVSNAISNEMGARKDAQAQLSSAKTAGQGAAQGQRK